MVLPLLILIPIILVGVILFFLLLPSLLLLAKLAVIGGVLYLLIKLLPKGKSKDFNKLATITSIIAVVVGIMALSSSMGFFAVAPLNTLPFNIDDPLNQSSLSPMNVVLAFIIFVQSVFIYRLKK